MGTLSRFARLDIRGETPNREEMTEIQRRLESALELLNQPWAAAVILSDTFDLVTGQENSVKHGLGRELSGWIVVNKTATADIWKGTGTTLPVTSHIDLRSSANVTVKLMVW